MKYLLFLFLLVSSLPAFSQYSNITGTPVTNTRTYGYIAGVRLDSIETEYAQFGYRNHRLLFDYGQPGNWKKQIVEDSVGKPLLIIDKFNTMFLVNLLYFNGWEVNDADSVADDGYSLLKKRKQK